MSEGNGWRVCTRCRLLKHPDDFYRTKKHTAMCRACNRLKLIARYRHVREWLWTYKLEHGCVDCGYRGHPAALEFDHLPGMEKTNDITRLMVKGKLELVQAEIEKCEVVCANCHHIRTFERMQWGQDHDLSPMQRSAKVKAGPPYEQLLMEVDESCS